MGVKVDIAAVVFATVLGAGSLGVSLMSYSSSADANTTAADALRVAQDANISAARTEITDYATQMVQLDREADERNGVQISVLAEQAKVVIDEYSEKNLQLAPATYRVLAEFAAFDVENRELAETLASTAVDVAKKNTDTVEQARAERAWATVAAQEGKIDGVETHLLRALKLTSSRNSSEMVEATRFTRAFSVYLAVRAADQATSKDKSTACRVAETYFAQPKVRKAINRTFSDQSLETSRRAYLLRGHIGKHICGRSSGITPDALHLEGFRAFWWCNPQRLDRSATCDR